MREIKRYKFTSNRYKAKDTGRIKAIRTINKMDLWKKFEEATHISELVNRERQEILKPVFKLYIKNVQTYLKYKK